ncbi:MAG: 3D domain-containing protein [Bacteroidales bacterium]|nr:3D domain-containing protein [Bacteroidales bacterium]
MIYNNTYNKQHVIILAVKRFFFFIMMVIWMIGIFYSCGRQYEKKQLEVTASAYNSLKNQTSDDPRVAAWGDTLRPGIKAVAVSRDLLDSGLTYGVKINIEGLSGRYMVTDKMHSRWKKKIDIYMGNDINKAREWGLRTVTITWKDTTGMN